MLTEIRNAETGELLEKGDMPSYYVVGEAIEVNGVRRTIDRIEEYVPRPNPNAGLPNFYQIIYVS